MFAKLAIAFGSCGERDVVEGQSSNIYAADMSQLVPPAASRETSNSLSRDELIVYYSLRGIPVGDIQCLLRRIHGYCISIRHLVRLRTRHGVGAKSRNESPIPVIADAMQREIAASGGLLGYRSMCSRLNLTHGLSVRRDTAMMMLSVIDPSGTESRRKRRLKRRVYRSKGPNFIWHADGYDKLKPFGITIHAAIDGYSRRIMWAQTAYSNNNPNIIAKYYLDTIEMIGGCPSIMRTDRGTENSVIAFLQPSLRHSHSDTFAQERSFQYGRSTANQRIEAWWSYLRSHMTDWWMDYFKDLQLNGYFDNSTNYCINNRDAIRYCFGPLIAKELTDLVTEWNFHRIRKSANAEAPGGIPEVLYHLPDATGAEDYKCPVQSDLLHEAQDVYGYSGELLVHETFKALADSICSEFELQYPPLRHEDALFMYFIIIDECRHLSS